jgi:hypothetical protein
MVTDLPEITAVQRLEIRPGDRIVVTAGQLDLHPEEAYEIQEAVRRVLGTDVPVLVLPMDWRLEVVSE